MTRKGRSLLFSSIVVILLLVVQFARPSKGGLWLQTLYESLHVPVFGVIAVCVLLITPARWGTRNRLIATMGTVIGLSVLSEAAQIPTSRDASFEDLIADVLGAAGFVCIATTFIRSLSVPGLRRAALVLLGVALIAWPLLPLAKVSAAYVERHQILPSLMRFDARFVSTFFRMQNAELTEQQGASPGSVAASILLQDGPWPGIVFNNLWPNWEPHTALIIEIENPDADELRINIRVHDRDHRDEQRYSDRFNRRLELAPGRQTLRIKLSDIQDAPADRQMNMAEIDGLIIFATRQESGRRFVLHEIRLE